MLELKLIKGLEVFSIDVKVTRLQVYRTDNNQQPATVNQFEFIPSRI